MQPSDFSTWTRQDWIAFDAIRQAAFALTPEEIQAQKDAQISQMKSVISSQFEKYNGTFYDTDLEGAITWYATSEPTLAEFVGDPEQWAKNQIDLSTDLLATLYQIVCMYP